MSPSSSVLLSHLNSLSFVLSYFLFLNHLQWLYLQFSFVRFGAWRMSVNVLFLCRNIVMRFKNRWPKFLDEKGNVRHFFFISFQTSFSGTYLDSEECDGSDVLLDMWAGQWRSSQFSGALRELLTIFLSFIFCFSFFTLIVLFSAISPFHYLFIFFFVSLIRCCLLFLSSDVVP